jgi:hypothetical protein
LEKPVRPLCLCVFLALVIASCVNHDIRPQAYDCSTSSLKLVLVETTPATGCGEANGSITVSVESGSPPFRFNVNEEFTLETSYDDLIPGVYTVSVIDSKGCEAVLPNINVNAEGLSFDAVVTPNTDCTGGNGSIEINVNEGRPPYQFKFGDGPFSAANTFEGLSAGSYDIVAADSESCISILHITVTRASTGTSWNNTIKPLMTTYCALSGCHNGKSRPDLRLYDKAKLYATQIKNLTADKSMPYEGSLTQQQIDLIACWVDEGALEN